MKKLILDTCTETVFSFNRKFYKQSNGGSIINELKSNVNTNYNIKEQQR